MPGDFWCGRGDHARVLFSFAREAAGALGIRNSPRPLLLRAAKQFLQNSGESRREIAEARRHCEERSDEAIHSSICGPNYGLLRSARNDDLKTTCIRLFEN